MVFYSLWAADRLSEGLNLLVLSVPFVMLLCLRYNMDMDAGLEDADPVSLIAADRVLVFFALACFAMVMLAVYLGG